MVQAFGWCRLCVVQAVYGAGCVCMVQVVCGVGYVWYRLLGGVDCVWYRLCVM